MPRKVDDRIFRLIDANFNRAKEGMRVCEDICRFIFDQRTLTRSYKNQRHRLTDVIRCLNMSEAIVEARNIEGDVGRGSTILEFKRAEVSDIFFANAQRVKESVRVLEEFAKLLNKKCAQDFKNIRYKIYALEKKVVKCM